MKKLKIWLKIDIFGELALRHVNLLFQKTTADDDDELTTDSSEVKSHANILNGPLQVIRAEIEFHLIGL